MGGCNEALRAWVTGATLSADHTVTAKNPADKREFTAFRQNRRDKP